MKIIKTFRTDRGGKTYRKNTEEKLLAEGYRVVAEEEFKERNWTGTCCLALIFLPLALLPIKFTMIKVTYEKPDNQ